MAWICFKDHSEVSILRYYDEVLQNILVNGVIHADTFNFFQFAFKILGRDFANSNSWESVVKGNLNLFTYIYAHKQGADYLQICLDSEDASVRQAAANMVGMWADEKRGVGLRTEHLELPPELLTKLADMVGTGEVGWAAINSFGALAKRNPQFLVQTLTSSNEPVLHRIAQLVNELSTRSLSSVRTLVLFYNKIFLQLLSAQCEGAGMMAMTDAVLRAAPTETNMTDAQLTTAARPAAEHITREDIGVAGYRVWWALPRDIEAELVRKLKHMLESSRVQRLRVQSAYLLYLLGKLDAPSRDLIRSINPRMDVYWYRLEQKMLEFFLKEMSPPAIRPPSYPRDIREDQEDIYEGGLHVDGGRPSWSAG